MHVRKSALQLRYIESDGEDDTEHYVWLHDASVAEMTFRLPRQGHRGLYRAPTPNPTNAWAPTSMRYYTLATLLPWFNAENGVGIKEWEIAELGRVPGKLQIGFWLHGTSPTTSPPDAGGIYPLDDTTDWTTGLLTVQSVTAETPLAEKYVTIGLRWFPANLRDLCP